MRRTHQTHRGGGTVRKLPSRTDIADVSFGGGCGAQFTTSPAVPASAASSGGGCKRNSLGRAATSPGLQRATSPSSTGRNRPRSPLSARGFAEVTGFGLRMQPSAPNEVILSPESQHQDDDSTSSSSSCSSGGPVDSPRGIPIISGPSRSGTPTNEERGTQFFSIASPQKTCAEPQVGTGSSASSRLGTGSPSRGGSSLTKWTESLMTPSSVAHAPLTPRGDRGSPLSDLRTSLSQRWDNAPDEAGGIVAPPRARSASGGHRAGSPRDYVVEVLSPSRARELSRELSSMPIKSDPQRSTDLAPSPRSPTLLLCPSKGKENQAGDGTTSLPSEGSVSVSSDEGEIRDRLRQSLHLRGRSGHQSAPSHEAPTRSQDASRGRQVAAAVAQWDAAHGSQAVGRGSTSLKPATSRPQASPRSGSKSAPWPQGTSHSVSRQSVATSPSLRSSHDVRTPSPAGRARRWDKREDSKGWAQLVPRALRSQPPSGRGTACSSPQTSPTVGRSLSGAARVASRQGLSAVVQRGSPLHPGAWAPFSSRTSRTSVFPKASVRSFEGRRASSSSAIR